MNCISSFHPTSASQIMALPKARADVQENQEAAPGDASSSEHKKMKHYGVIVCSDVNRDGRDEVVHQNLHQGVVISTPHESPDGSGYDAFPEVHALPDDMGDPSWKLVGSGTFGDNPWEALFFQQGSTGKLRANWIHADLFNQGERFSMPSCFPCRKFEVIGVADYNRDKHSDLFIRDRKTGDIAIWLLKDGAPGRAAGTANIIHLDDDSGLNTEWKVIGMGSFHPGGTHDMVSRSPEGAVKVSLYDGTHRFGETLLHDPETAGGDDPIVGTGDIDGDGATDLLRLDINGQLHASIMNGIYEQRRDPLFYLSHAGRDGGHAMEREE